jgi:hypothetical protein
MFPSDKYLGSYVRVYAERHAGVYIERCPLLICEFNPNHAQVISVKLLNTKFHKNPFIGSGVATCGQIWRKH